MSSPSRRARSKSKGPKPPAELEARFKPAELVVVDAETGSLLRLNTRTVLERAEARGDTGFGGASSNSAVVHALPRLALDVEKSAQLHMFIEAQRQIMIEAVKLEEKAEAARLESIEAEPMLWRRRKLKEEVFADRVEAQKRLEAMRSQQELDLLRKARELGLLA